jgi:hypothetical protein
VGPVVGRCRLTVSKPVLIGPMFSAVETKISCHMLSMLAFNFQLAPLHRGVDPHLAHAAHHPHRAHRPRDRAGGTRQGRGGGLPTQV